MAENFREDGLTALLDEKDACRPRDRAARIYPALRMHGRDDTPIGANGRVVPVELGYHRGLNPACRSGALIVRTERGCD